MTARELLSDLHAADLALAAHCERRPAEIRVWHGPLYDAAYAEWSAWYAERDRLAAVRDAALAKGRGLICQRCVGTGQTVWKHRHQGVCYQCKGDGWTTKGRRQHSVTAS